LALGFAALSAVLGHVSAITLPALAGRWVGLPDLGATSSAAMMAVTAGGLFLVAWLASSIRNRLASR
jgi:hypothetical protein